MYTRDRRPQTVSVPFAYAGPQHPAHLPEEVSSGQAVFPSLDAACGETQPLHIRPSLSKAALPASSARGGAITLLQTPEGHRPIDRLEDDGTTLLGDGPPVAHVAANQPGDGVEALHLELVLHAAVGLAEPQNGPVDLKVLSEVLPLAGQDEVSRAGQGVTNQEVPIPLHKVFRHL